MSIPMFLTSLSVLFQWFPLPITRPSSWVFLTPSLLRPPSPQCRFHPLPRPFSPSLYLFFPLPRQRAFPRFEFRENLLRPRFARPIYLVLPFFSMSFLLLDDDAVFPKVQSFQMPSFSPHSLPPEILDKPSASARSKSSGCLLLHFR